MSHIHSFCISLRALGCLRSEGFAFLALGYPASVAFIAFPDAPHLGKEPVEHRFGTNSYARVEVQAGWTLCVRVKGH